MKKLVHLPLAFLSLPFLALFIGCVHAEDPPVIEPPLPLDQAPAAKGVPAPAAPAAAAPAAAEAAAPSAGAALVEVRADIAARKAAKAIHTDRAGWKTRLPKYKLLTFKDGESYEWILDTNKGKITVDLNHKTAPNHVSSTIYLTELGFYNGLKFHRVIPGFMAQGGCPIGRGTGGPGYEYDGEYDPTVKHNRGGLLSMANRGPGTDGSQFFLTFVPTPWLDGRHTIFGSVSDGMDVVKTLETFGSRSGATSELLEINTATVQLKK